MIKISIIIPVFNKENLLLKCLKSVSNQTFHDFEVIIIDDGSTDSSGAICDEYAKKDNRIKVYHKKNGGVSSARQYGVDRAKGLYTIHVDPDDYVEKHYLEKLYFATQNQEFDIVSCNYFIKRGDEKEIIKSELIDSDDNTINIKKLLEGKIHGSLCNKLIRTNYYKDNDIYFPKGINIGEDIFVLISILLKNPRVNHINIPLYYYVQHENSITNFANTNKYQEKIELINRLSKLLSELDLSKSLAEMKLQLRRDALIELPNSFDIKKIFPETNSIILRSDSLSPFPKVLLISEIYFYGLFTPVLMFIQKKISNKNWD